MTNNLDTKVIAELAAILEKHNLTDFEYETETCRISLGKNVQITSAPVAQVISAPVATAPTSNEVANTPTPINSEADYSKDPNALKSPMVGVAYLSADPSSPNYVNVGDNVKEGDTICLIEAMKTFNPVKAHKAGTIKAILIEAGDPIEFGQVLAVIA